MESDSLKEILNEDIIKNVNSILNGKWIGDSKNNIYDYKLKVIPFSSLGNPNGVLLGFKPDYIKIDKTYIKKDVLIGIYDGKLSKTNMYKSLVGLNILKEGKDNEFAAIN